MKIKNVVLLFVAMVAGACFAEGGWVDPNNLTPLYLKPGQMCADYPAEATVCHSSPRTYDYGNVSYSGFWVNAYSYTGPTRDISGDRPGVDGPTYRSISSRYYGVAENGDRYGVDNDGDGYKENTFVSGYRRSDGTYMRSHYRADRGSHSSR